MPLALERPLHHLSIVAIVTNVPGPVAAARLQAFGARVVKIEPQSGDALELSAPDWYREVVAGMNVLRIDFRDPVARASLEGHLAGADVALTSMRASSLERIDFAWEKLHARHPQLIHVAISGEGPPNDDRAGHDLTYQARAGTISGMQMPRALVADMAAAERAVSATLAAVLTRDRTGIATRTEVAIVDAATDFAAPHRYKLTSAAGVLGGALATYRIYGAKRGHVALAALEPHFLARLRAMLENDALDVESLTRAFAQRAADEWEALADEFDVPLAAVRDA